MRTDSWVFTISQKTGTPSAAQSSPPMTNKIPVYRGGNACSISWNADLSLLAKLLDQPVIVWIGGSALLLFGLFAALSLPIRSSPVVPYDRIEISTDFPGADAGTIDHFITLPLEAAAAAQSGVKYVTGTSVIGNSDINVFLADQASSDEVFAEILAAENATRGNLPAGALPSKLTLVGDDQTSEALSIVVLFPSSVSAADIAAFVTANVIPRLETVPGVGPVALFPGQPSLHVNTDLLRLEASGITPLELFKTLSQTSSVYAAGELRDSASAIPLNMISRTNGVSDFNTLPIPSKRGQFVVLRALASTAIGFSPGSDETWWNGRSSVVINVGVAPRGNIIVVSKSVRDLLSSLRPMLPSGVRLAVDYDKSIGVSESLRDLGLTLIITALLVCTIVRLSLGSLRAAVAPLVTIVLSLLGAAVVMEIIGQTFNLFTIVALVLAVGLVVDDAIVVVEDVFRRVFEGTPPLESAKASVMRLAPVLAAISLTLAVAFLPLAFLSGLTATLFRPFAVVLISAVLLSLIIALTVVPSIAMWASRVKGRSNVGDTIDHVSELYLRMLKYSLRFQHVILVGVVAAVFLCFVILKFVPKNLNPAPDGLSVNIFAAGPSDASAEYMESQAKQLENVLHKTFPEKPDWLDASEQTQSIVGGYSFNTPDEATRAVHVLRKVLDRMDGISAYASQASGLPGSNDLPVSINISGQVSGTLLLEIAAKVQSAAYASGDFDYITINPGQPEYQIRLNINKMLAAQLGISEAEIRRTVAASLSGGSLGEVNITGNAMSLVMGMQGQISPQLVEALPVRSAVGTAIPLGTVLTLADSEQPNALGSWQGLPSINIQAKQTSGIPLNRALEDLNREFIDLHSPDLTFNYTGSSEIFRDSNQENIKLFVLGLLGLFFLLAAQFQSLRDPFVVITTVPLASLGPLLFCLLGGATLNIVSEIALLTVWGLIARQGILFVQVANEGYKLDISTRDAALRAARLRFRPILMITVALIGGAIPLIIATGPQATVRYDLGVVIATGMGSGFLLSLFAVPGMYCLLHKCRSER
jgi:multidrug efflux pump